MYEREYIGNSRMQVCSDCKHGQIYDFQALVHKLCKENPIINKS